MVDICAALGISPFESMTGLVRSLVLPCGIAIFLQGPSRAAATYSCGFRSVGTYRERLGRKVVCVFDGAILSIAERATGAILASNTSVTRDGRRRPHNDA